MSATTNKRDILARVRMELGLQDITNYNPLLKDMINEHIREFDCFEIYLKKQVNLPIDQDGWVCLPDDFYSLGLLRATCVTGWSGGQHTATAPFVYGDFNTLNRWGINCNFPDDCGTGTYQLTGDRIKLMGNFINVKTANLCYEAYNVDQYGNFIGIPKSFYTAVVKRIVHDFMVMPNNAKDYLRVSIDAYDAKALASFNQCKAQSTLRLLENTRPQMLDIVNSILIDKNVVNY